MAASPFVAEWLPDRNHARDPHGPIGRRLDLVDAPVETDHK